MAYPGNKGKREVPKGFTKIYDLFTGGGNWTLAVLRTSPNAVCYGAEANPMQRQILRGMAKIGLHHACDVACRLKASLNPAWSGKGEYGKEFPDDWQRTGKIWKHEVKRPFDEALAGCEIKAEHIAAQLLVSTYGYGTNIRTSGNGLNVSPNAHKIKHRNVDLPIVPVYQSVASSFDQIQIQGGRNTIVLIDPPYWMPPATRSSHKLLTSCYPGHQPYGDCTRDFYVKSIVMALEANAGYIIVAGYYSDELNDIVLGLGQGYYQSVLKFESLNKQASRHKHRLVHGNRSASVDLLDKSRLPNVYKQLPLLVI